MNTETPAVPAVSPAEAPVGTTLLMSKSAKQTWNIAPEDVTQNTRHYDPPVRDLLRWLHAWAIHSRPAKRMDEAAEAVGVDRTTLYRVYAGKYQRDNGEARVSEKLVSGIIALKRVEELRRDEGRVPFIVTKTSTRIFRAAEICLARGRIGMVWGDSQIGKTCALREFARLNNHGQTKYVCLAPGGGVVEMLRSLAVACGISPSSSSSELKQRIIGALDKNNLVIVDEVHQTASTYQRRSKLTCLELLRWIHDQTGCGMLLCGTNVWKDMLERDRDSKALEQLARRGAVKLQLASKIPQEDLDAIYAAFELAPPEGDTAKTMRRLADAMGMTVVIETLALGQRKAKRGGRDFPSWDEVMDAHEILADMESGASAR